MKGVWMGEEQVLLERSLGGSLEAFDDLVKIYQRPVFRIAYSHVRDVDAALDIAQNAFVKAYENLSSFRQGGHFKAWLFQIACRESLSWLRQAKRWRQAVALEDIEEPRGEAVGQEVRLIEAEARGALLSEVGRLNRKQQLAVSMRYFDGASLPEIADALGCEVPLVKNILFRSLQKLRRRMGQATECVE